jgi:ABC-type multidrug transport system ATPase subunit
MKENNSVISIESLSKRFGSKYAVKNLSFNVQKGDLFGFLGPNGAGKSTSLYMLLGLAHPTGGKATLFNGKSFKKMEVRRKVGAMLESPTFYSNLSAEKNLEISARLLGEEAISTIPEVLDMMEISDVARMKVRKFSTGMKQKLGIARALLGSPELLILDEPTNGLDPEARSRTWKILEEYTAKGNTILISSHLLYEIEEHCNRVCVIKEGKCAAFGLVKELLEFKKRPWDILCEDEKSLKRLKNILNITDWIEEKNETISLEKTVRIIIHNHSPADLHCFLVENNIRIEQFNPVKKTLNEFFLSLIKKEKTITEK